MLIVQVRVSLVRVLMRDVRVLGLLSFVTLPTLLNLILKLLLIKFFSSLQWLNNLEPSILSGDDLLDRLEPRIVSEFNLLRSKIDVFSMMNSTWSFDGLASFTIYELHLLLSRGVERNHLVSGRVDAQNLLLRLLWGYVLNGEDLLAPSINSLETVLPK